MNVRWSPGKALTRGKVLGPLSKVKDSSRHFLSGFLVILLDMEPFDQRILPTSSTSPWILAKKKHHLKPELKILLES